MEQCYHAPLLYLYKVLGCRRSILKELTYLSHLYQSIPRTLPS
jgi:hypothetical protein